MDVDIGGCGFELGSIPNPVMVLKWTISIMSFGCPEIGFLNLRKQLNSIPVWMTSLELWFNNRLATSSSPELIVFFDPVLVLEKCSVCMPINFVSICGQSVI